MKRILVLGAGRSSASVIRYLLDHAASRDWFVIVADVSLKHATEKVGHTERGQAIALDMNEPEATRKLIANADIVISLMPPALHPMVALYCLQEKKHFLTASYLSDEVRSLDAEARAHGLLFLNECGLDPGIDHLSAMKVIDEIRAAGGEITGFESFTGGIIAPETDPQNPWRYKFTWNPQNVVKAGQGTAKFLLNGVSKYIPYQQLFRRTTSVHVPGYGDCEGYANRNSLKYIDAYGLNGIGTMLRGTLRSKGFCAAWNLLVQLGCCEDHYELENVESLTHRGFVEAFLPAIPGCTSVEERVCAYLAVDRESSEVAKLRWSGLFDDTPIGRSNGTPAQILEHILAKNWALVSGDRDLIVMWHRFRYRLDGIDKEIQASLVVTGDDDVHTAMAKTVGLPLGIVTRLIALEQIMATGVQIPITPEFYNPVLKELAQHGIVLNEVQVR